MKSLVHWVFSDYDISKRIEWFFGIILLVSAFKNLVIWRFFEVHDGSFYHYPLLTALETIPVYFDWFILFISLSTIPLIFVDKGWVKLIPYMINGVANIYFMLSDYLALHHDMLLSGMVFIAYGLYLWKKNTSIEVYIVRLLVAIVSSTYLLSGIVKMDGGFLSGEMASTIIQRAEVFPYWPVMELIQPYSSLLSWFAMGVEVVESIMLLLVIGVVKFYSMLVAFPFHLGILLTGTGTVYNLIYPASFIFILNYFSPTVLRGQGVIQASYRGILFVFLGFSVMYIFMLFAVMIKRLFVG